jgi:predicted ester cyclase
MKKLLFQFITIVPLALFLGMTFGCQKQIEKGLAIEEAQAIIDNFLKFRNEGNLAAADKVMHPDCVIRYPNLPEKIVGLEAYKEYDRMTRLSFPDFKMVIDDFFVKDDKIVSYWTLDATNTGPLATPLGELPPTNNKVHVSGIAISRVVDGKIIEDVGYFNMLEMMLQLGFTLNPPAPPGSPAKKS